MKRMQKDLRFREDSKELEIVSVLQKAGFRAYYVGGAVRDSLLGGSPSDIDIATDATPECLDQLFKRTIPLGRRFGIVAIPRDSGGQAIEVATFRSDGIYEDHRKPNEVRFGTEEEDASRRDFTINGIFYDPLKKEVIDYVGGLEDIGRAILRTIGNAKERFNEDALRILRAIRFISNLSLSYDEELITALRASAHLLFAISKERIRDELVKMFCGPNPSQALRLLDESGVLKVVLPELDQMHGVLQSPKEHPEGDVFMHTVKVMSNLKNVSIEVAFGALLHDVAKPLCVGQKEGRITFYHHDQKGSEVAKEILSRLRFKNSEIKSISGIIRDHLKFFNAKKMKDSTLMKFFSEDYFEALLEVHRADCLGGSGNLEAYHYCIEKREELTKKHKDLKPIPLVNGEDLIALGLSPGPQFKKILKEAYEFQLNEEELDKKSILRALGLL